jgi:hypothetical protein
MYLSEFLFRYLDSSFRDQVFKYCLLFNEKIYLPFPKEEFGWATYDIGGLDKKRQNKIISEIKKQGSESDKLYHLPLRIYIDSNPDVFKNLYPSFDSINQMNELGMYLPNAIVSPTLMKLIYDIYLKVKPKLDDIDLNNIASMTNNLLLVYHLRKSKGIDSVFSSGDRWILEEISKIEEDIDLRISHDYHSYNSLPKTSRDLTSFLIGKSDPIQKLSEILIPNLESIPILELSKFIKKNKNISLIKYLNNLKDTYQELSVENVLEETLKYFFKYANEISPNIPTLVGSFIGNLPTGHLLVNPVGLIMFGKESHDLFKSRRKYPFIFTINQLNKMHKH